MGKGGVGKSTVAALCGVALEERVKKTLIVSMDPAHNLSDIFKKRLSEKPSNITPVLSAMEVNEEKLARAYLNDISEQMKSSYSYLTSFNLQHYFNVIKHSPGLEEYALILAFNKIRKEHSLYDYILFDMPPTALALKFFNLPSLSLLWIEHLINLRREIIEKRGIITKIRILKNESETDKIYKRLNNNRDYFLSLENEFKNSKSVRINLVTNPDTLSLAESERIYSELEEMGISVNRLIRNKTEGRGSIQRIRNSFVDIPATDIPNSKTPLLGLDNLKNFSRDHNEIIYF